MVENFNMITPIKLDENIDPNVAALAQYVGEEMREQLSFIALQPKIIFDLGCQSALMTPALRERFPSADIVSENFPNNLSADFVIANLVLAWQADFFASLKKIRQQTKVGGLLMFSMFGPDTLIELPDRSIILPALIDMHNLGDILVKNGFADPVLDVEYVTLTYRDIEKLSYEMRATKMINQNAQNLQLMPNDKNIFSLTFEIIYAHAFAAPEKFLADDFGVTRFPAANILRRNK